MKKKLLFLTMTLLWSCFLNDRNTSSTVVPARISDLKVDTIPKSGIEDMFFLDSNGFFHFQKMNSKINFCFSNFNRSNEWCASISDNISQSKFFIKNHIVYFKIYNEAISESPYTFKLCSTLGCRDTNKIKDSTEFGMFTQGIGTISSMFILPDINFNFSSLYQYFPQSSILSDTLSVFESANMTQKLLFSKKRLGSFKWFDAKVLDSNRIRLGYVSAPFGLDSYGQNDFLLINPTITVGYQIVDRSGSLIEQKEWKMDRDSTKPTQLHHFAFTEGDLMIPIVIDMSKVSYVPNWNGSQKWLVLSDSSDIAATTCWQGLCTHRGSKSFQFRYPQ